MTATIMDGTAVAAEMLGETAARAARFEHSTGRKATLAAVLVGDDPASATYVRMKVNRCRRVGLSSRSIHLDLASATDEVISVVRDLSEDESVDGILVQHPVPAHIDERAVFESISPAKDVDGVTRASLSAMALGDPGFASCTPGGILRLLDAYRVDLVGMNTVVLGRSPILGLPVGLLLLARNATVTYCHSRTLDLAAQVGRADLVIAAVGKPALIDGDWIKAGAIVVDAGYHAVGPGVSGAGDVGFASAAQRARLITPVPGGVGPMTIATLLTQTIEAAEMRSAGPAPSRSGQ